MVHVLDELQWRGLIAQHSDYDALRRALDSGMVTYYCGFDPTAASLHHGHLVAIKVMRHLQLAGHRPLALVGGATGLIGDPRPSKERPLSSKDQVAQWVNSLRSQLSNFLDFEGENAAQIVNNYDWTSELSALDFLRDIGKHFRLGTMLSRDIVARRLNSEDGISFTEFAYQILQANDFLQLYRRYGCSMQVAGNDQWGNIVGGLDLIRKVEEGADVHVFTSPLITKADGTKFGKSEGGAIWLDPTMYSPYKFYQFWLNTADEDVLRLLKVYTFLSREEIESIYADHSERPGARLGQRTLAREVTAWVHGKEVMERVEAASRALFGGEDLHSLDGQTLSQAFDELESTSVHVGENFSEIFVRCGLEKGISAARRTIKAGGLYVNNEKIADDSRQLESSDVLDGGYVLLRKGKKNLAVGIAE